MQKLSQLWVQYTAAAWLLQMLLPALASADDIKLTYVTPATTLSVENKILLMPLITALEAHPKLKIHIATTSPLASSNHQPGQDRLDWVEAFLRERNHDITTQIQSTTYLYTRNDNSFINITW